MPDFDEIKHKLNETVKTSPPVRVIVVSFLLLILAGQPAHAADLFQGGGVSSH